MWRNNGKNSGCWCWILFVKAHWCLVKGIYSATFWLRACLFAGKRLEKRLRNENFWPHNTCHGFSCLFDRKWIGWNDAPHQHFMLSGFLSKRVETWQPILLWFFFSFNSLIQGTLKNRHYCKRFYNWVLLQPKKEHWEMLLDPPWVLFTLNIGPFFLQVKRDYVEGMGDSLDLVPIGAWHGNGRKVGWYRL